MYRSISTIVPIPKLGDKAVLFTPISLANSAARGYLDTRHERHGIDHMVVGDLGSQEILLVCTDTGNVAAYYTRHIEHIVRGLLARSPEPHNHFACVPAFFTYWVGESAWALPFILRLE